MAEYIDREKLRDALYDADAITMRGVAILNRFPAADVEPVVHGMWIWDDEGYHCSECFYHAYGETGEVLSGNWHFCPNCGARLDGDGE